MQQVIRKLPQAISERWSRKKLELQPKEVDLTYLDKWLETEVQVKEMAFGCSNTENSKQDGAKFKPKSNKWKWLKKKKYPPKNTFAISGAKTECFICKGEHGIKRCETWRKEAINDRWELAKKSGLCFRCLKTNHQIVHCSLRDLYGERRWMKTPSTTGNTGRTFHYPCNVCIRNELFLSKSVVQDLFSFSVTMFWYGNYRTILNGFQTWFDATLVYRFNEC